MSATMQSGLMVRPATHTEAGLRRCPVACTSERLKGRQCALPIKRGEKVCAEHARRTRATNRGRPKLIDESEDEPGHVVTVDPAFLEGGLTE